METETNYNQHSCMMIYKHFIRIIKCAAKIELLIISNASYVNYSGVNVITMSRYAKQTETESETDVNTTPSPLSNNIHSDVFV